MRILQLMSCRGWSSDAYWAARIGRELARRGHEVTLGCRAGSEAKVIGRVRAEGVDRVTTFRFGSGVRPRGDVADVRALRARLPGTDLVHVHRSKEHWLAAVANRLTATPRPIVRTRHIVQAVRPHAANRWLYRRATALVVTVTEAIRRQYLAADLMPADRVIALPGGADDQAYRPAPRDPDLFRRLGGVPGVPLIGMLGGLRVMKGHAIVIEAATRLADKGLHPRFVFVGRGSMEAAIRDAVTRAGLADRITLAGFLDDLAPAMAAVDIALYVPVESEGMSRIVFEYLAAGRPLVAARVGAVPEILVDGAHAILVPAGDAGELAAALAGLLSDPLRAQRLGEAGRQLVSARYSGARVAEALEAWYTRLAAA
jgi:glycosyltransferase involved in cell wall biosynthesis